MKKIISHAGVAAAAIATANGFLNCFIAKYGYEVVGKLVPTHITTSYVISYIGAVVLLLMSNITILKKGTYGVVKKRGKIIARKTVENAMAFLPLRNWQRISAIEYEWSDDDGHYSFVLDCSAAAIIPQESTLSGLIARCDEPSEARELVREYLLGKKIFPLEITIELYESEEFLEEALKRFA